MLQSLKVWSEPIHRLCCMQRVGEIKRPQPNGMVICIAAVHKTCRGRIEALVSQNSDFQWPNAVKNEFFRRKTFFIEKIYEFPFLGEGYPKRSPCVNFRAPPKDADRPALTKQVCSTLPIVPVSFRCALPDANGSRDCAPQGAILHCDPRIS